MAKWRRAWLSPLLLYFPDRQRNTAYQASHATYNLSRRLIETLYAEKLTEWLVIRVGPAAVSQEARPVGEGTRLREGWRHAKAAAAESVPFVLKSIERSPAMAEALREAIFRSASGTPLDFYRQLGVKSGFIRPAGNNAVRKYYTLEGVLLEALLASILPEGQMTFREFLEQLYLRYGLLTGGRTKTPPCS